MGQKNKMDQNKRGWIKKGSIKRGWIKMGAHGKWSKWGLVSLDFDETWWKRILLTCCVAQWCWFLPKMSGKLVKKGSKLICHFWRSFELKICGIDSSFWDPEISWDVWLSECKRNQKRHFPWFVVSFFRCSLKLWIGENWPWWCPFELKKCANESSQSEDLFSDLPRSKKLYFVRFSDGKLRELRARGWGPAVIAQRSK